LATLFISDLHLDSRRPAITALFLEFLEQRAADAEALYILGDLFEVWIGDDDDEPLGKEIASALKTLNQRGVPLYLMHGNRDFLLGEGFAAVSGAKLLPQAVVVDLYSTPTLIMHGDSLCTDDVEYQTLRSRVRSPQWQAQILSLPLPQRREIAKQLRDKSQQVTLTKAADITDVNPAAVIATLREHGVCHLIHGHTHRPGIHQWESNGATLQRIVLGDWYEQGSVLCCDATGCRLENLSLS
jgi:UDP-2,3-diacylglucosamine hydrolase